MILLTVEERAGLRTRINPPGSVLIRGTLGEKKSTRDERSPCTVYSNVKKTQNIFINRNATSHTGLLNRKSRKGRVEYLGVKF